MKSKLTRRLIIYFTIVLLAYAIVVSILLLLAGEKNFKAQYEENISFRASSIANAITENSYLFKSDEPVEKTSVEKTHTGKIGKGKRIGAGTEMSGGAMSGGAMGGGGMHSPGPGYLKMIDDIAMGDVWIVDENAQSISVGTGKREVKFTELSIDARSIVTEVFDGNTVTTESFSSSMGETYITAGAPIKDKEGNVIAVLLLHEKISVMQSYIKNSTSVILISTAVAAALVMVLAIIFAKRFIKPLDVMGKVAEKLIEGEYHTKTGIVQDDELGDLANNIDQLSERLAKSKADSDSLEQLRRDFISNISHELKTPVTVLRSSMEALMDGVIDSEEEVDEYHKVVYEEGLVMERLIGDLLELSGLQNNNYQINKEEINLIDILRDAVRSQRQISKEVNIDIDLNVDSESIPFFGDYTRLRQMFIIVINNGIKFSYPGESVQIFQQTFENKVVVKVINRGPVIDEIELDRIFLQFYRDSSAVKAGTKGSGLGLAIAKQIAERHGIDIVAESSLESGTVFSFTFFMREFS